MNLAEIERLAGELLATGDMTEDTRADLDRIVAEARAGQSHADDLDYLRALHARVLSAEPVAETDSDPASSDNEIADLHSQIAQLRTELEAARQTIAELETRLASGV